MVALTLAGGYDSPHVLGISVLSCGTDRSRRGAVASPRKPGTTDSRGIAIDEAHGLVFAGCAEGRVIALDAADKYFEVIVDHETGKVARSEAITGGEDLAEAKKQAAAMGKTKRSLRDAVTKAEKANAGFKAVSVEAEIEGSVAQADINLLKGTEAKHVEDKL